MTKELKCIPTKAKDDAPNGFIVPIWHVDQDPAIEQVYLTAIEPFSMKGPHLHHKREGRFTVIQGRVLIVTRVNGKYEEQLCCSSDGYATVTVPAGVPAALYNLGGFTALVLNMPNPAWRDNSDEHPVENWGCKPA